MHLKPKKFCACGALKYSFFLYKHTKKTDFFARLRRATSPSKSFGATDIIGSDPETFFNPPLSKGRPDLRYEDLDQNPLL